METFTKDEISKLDQFKKLFKVDSLTTDQIEVILDRKIETKVSLKSKVKNASIHRCVLRTTDFPLLR